MFKFSFETMFESCGRSFDNLKLFIEAAQLKILKPGLWFKVDKEGVQPGVLVDELDKPVDSTIEEVATHMGLDVCYDPEGVKGCLSKCLKQLDKLQGLNIEQLQAFELATEIQKKDAFKVAHIARVPLINVVERDFKLYAEVFFPWFFNNQFVICVKDKHAVLLVNEHLNLADFKLRPLTPQEEYYFCSGQYIYYCEANGRDEMLDDFDSMISKYQISTEESIFTIFSGLGLNSMSVASIRKDLKARNEKIKTQSTALVSVKNLSPQYFQDVDLQSVKKLYQIMVQLIPHLRAFEGQILGDYKSSCHEEIILEEVVSEDQSCILLKRKFPFQDVYGRFKGMKLMDQTEIKVFQSFSELVTKTHDVLSEWVTHAYYRNILYADKKYVALSYLGYSDLITHLFIVDDFRPDKKQREKFYLLAKVFGSNFLHEYELWSEAQLELLDLYRLGNRSIYVLHMLSLIIEEIGSSLVLEPSFKPLNVFRCGDYYYTKEGVYNMFHKCVDYEIFSLDYLESSLKYMLMKNEILLLNGENLSEVMLACHNSTTTRYRFSVYDMLMLDDNEVNYRVDVFIEEI